MTYENIAKAAQDAADALLALGSNRPELACTLSGLMVTIAQEAGRTPRFANALQDSMATGSTVTPKAKRTGRRPPGIIDPFAIYSQEDEQGLRLRLTDLDLEQLRDIVAEHGMDHDRLAMKWKDPQRVIDRIVEKVVSRTSKGSAFRPDST